MERNKYNSLDLVQQLQTEATLCLSRGNKSAAEDLYSQAHQIILSTVGPLHRMTAENLVNLGAANFSLGLIFKARKLFRNALNIAVITRPCDDQLCITAHIRLAKTYITEDKLVEAELIYKDFLNTLLDQPQKNHTAIAAVHTELAHLYAESGRMEKTLEEIDCIRKNYDQLINTLSTAQHGEQSAGIEHARLAYFFALSLILRYFKYSTNATQAMLLYTFRRKMLQMEFDFVRQQALTQFTNYSKSSLQKALLNVRQRLIINSNVFNRKSENSDICYRKLQNDESQRQELEVFLSRISSKPPVLKMLNTIELRDITDALSSEETFIEFVKYRRYDFSNRQNENASGWQEFRYLAFVIKTDPCIDVHVVDLGNAACIDSLVNEFHAKISNNINLPSRGLVADNETHSKTSSSSGVKLRQQIIDPLLKKCTKYSKLILVLDSALWTIPFGTLPLDEGKGSLTDRYNISYLNSGRELIKRKHTDKTFPSEPLVISDPECNQLIRKWSKNSFITPYIAIFSKLLSLFKNQSRTSLLKSVNNKFDKEFTSNSAIFKTLPGAGTEAKIVARLLGVSIHHRLKLRKTLFQKKNSPRILHIATHGCFFPDEANSLSKGNECKNLSSRYAPINNPMLRSTILLSNKQFTPPIPLSAEQVLNFDLQSTDLVVLSACDSGVGEIKTGEGIFGLQRAFLLVGAKTVIMSLWKVADLPTTLLMYQFYRNLIQKHQRIDDSLRNAQKFLQNACLNELYANVHTAEIIETICTKEPNIQKVVDWYGKQPKPFRPFEDPFFWGGFVLVGNNTSLME